MKRSFEAKRIYECCGSGEEQDYGQFLEALPISSDKFGKIEIRRSKKIPEKINMGIDPKNHHDRQEKQPAPGKFFFFPEPKQQKKCRQEKIAENLRTDLPPLGYERNKKHRKHRCRCEVCLTISNKKKNDESQKAQKNIYD